MSTDISALFDKLVEQANHTADKDDQTFEPAAPVVAEGTAFKERIRVRIENGKVTEFDLRPEAMRLTNADLGDHLVTAVNAALAAYQQAMTEAITDEQTDFGQLQSQLRDMQSESLRVIDKYTDAMGEMLRKAKVE